MLCSALRFIQVDPEEVALLQARLEAGEEIGPNKTINRLSQQVGLSITMMLLSIDMLLSIAGEEIDLNKVSAATNAAAKAAMDSRFNK
jgi:hypothetical protein